jgi:hypothetical protein
VFLSIVNSLYQLLHDEALKREGDIPTTLTKLLRRMTEYFVVIRRARFIPNWELGG